MTEAYGMNEQIAGDC